MKKVMIALTVSLILSAFYHLPAADKFSKLYALEGTWLMQTKRGFIGEEWKKLDDDNLKGRGFYIRGADTVTTENITLKNTKAGIFYVPVVANQNNGQPVIFTMTNSGDNSFVFENPEHDFPKRIVYKMVTADSLHAYADDGTETGKKQNFYYRRIKQ